MASRFDPAVAFDAFLIEYIVTEPSSDYLIGQNILLRLQLTGDLVLVDTDGLMSIVDKFPCLHPYYILCRLGNATYTKKPISVQCAPQFGRASVRAWLRYNLMVEAGETMDCLSSKYVLDDMKFFMKIDHLYQIGIVFGSSDAAVLADICMEPKQWTLSYSALSSHEKAYCVAIADHCHRELLHIVYFVGWGSYVCRPKPASTQYTFEKFSRLIPIHYSWGATLHKAVEIVHLKWSNLITYHRVSLGCLRHRKELEGLTRPKGQEKISSNDVEILSDLLIEIDKQ